MTMKVTKALITAAGRNQRTLPIQLLVDRDGLEKPLLQILIEEARSAGIDDIGVVVAPGDEQPFLKAIRQYTASASDSRNVSLTFISQAEPLGYGHAVYCGRDYLEGEPFLHLVGDHLHISGSDKSCALQLVETAESEECSVSAVQPTREGLLPFFGAVGGRRVQARNDLYQVDTVIEKPAPTEAEMRLLVPGLRAGRYLCFFGMHVLTPSVIDILGERVTAAGATGGVTLSDALSELSGREKYLALEEHAWRYDVGARYGMISAQLALALSGQDRDEVLGLIVDLLAQRELGALGRR